MFFLLNIKNFTYLFFIEHVPHFNFEHAVQIWGQNVPILTILFTKLKTDNRLWLAFFYMHMRGKRTGSFPILASLRDAIVPITSPHLNAKIERIRESNYGDNFILPRIVEALQTL